MTDERIERVRSPLKYAAAMPDDGIPEWGRELRHRARLALPHLDSLERELTELREKNDWLNGKWEAAADRCPQCGTGVKASPYVRALERELTELREALTLSQAVERGTNKAYDAAREVVEAARAFLMQGRPRLLGLRAALSRYDEVT